MHKKRHIYSKMRFHPNIAFGCWTGFNYSYEIFKGSVAMYSYPMHTTGIFA